MNKQTLISVGGGVLGGVVTNGMNAFLPQSESPILNIGKGALCIYGFTKISGNSSKDNLMKGALMGAGLVDLGIAANKIYKTYIAPKVTGTGVVAKFANGAFGLACPRENEGLNGTFIGNDGQTYQFDESGLSGTYVDQDGNIISDQGLNGEIENELYGLNGIQSVYGEEENEAQEHGLNGIEEELYLQY